MTNKYKFIKHLGKGTSSSVDLVEDENGHTLVIKHCNMENKNAWKEECLKEIAITSSLAQTNITCNFPILQMKNIADEDIMISTFIQGKELSKDVLDKLSKHQQTNIAENLAEFLYHLHSQEIIPQHKNSSSYCLDLFNGKEKKIKERLDLLPEEIKKQVKQVMLEIDNDAVYIIGSRPIVVQQVSPLVYFRLAERYTSFYSVKKIRYYYYSSRFDNSENLTPKGLGEVAIGLHKNFMLDFLSELFYTNQYEGLDAGLRLLASFYQTYCSRTLPIEYYRNLNPQSMYTFIGFDQYATFYTSIYQDPRFKHLIDISYNERLLREFNQVLSYRYFRKE